MNQIVNICTVTMQRPSPSTKAEWIHQWTYEGSCSFMEKLNDPRKEYNNSSSLICSALFVNIKKSYEVYFSTSTTHQLRSSEYETVSYLPIYRIDPNDLKIIDCHGSKCCRALSTYEEIRCRSCKGDLEARELIQRFIRLPSFNEIPESCILKIKVTENDMETLQSEIAWIHKEMVILEKDVDPGGKYDLIIDEHTKKVEQERDGDRRRMEEWMVQLREYSSST